MRWLRSPYAPGRLAIGPFAALPLLGARAARSRGNGHLPGLALWAVEYTPVRSPSGWRTGSSFRHWKADNSSWRVTRSPSLAGAVFYTRNRSLRTSR